MKFSKQWMGEYVDLPETAALIDMLTMAGLEVDSVATPLPFSVPVPILTPPSKKVTVPVRVPAPGAEALTVAVKVTDWPDTDGFALEVRAVLVLALLTTWPPASEPVLVLKLLSPLYVALTVWVPTASVEVTNVAVVPETVDGAWAVPSMVKVTVPLGVPAPGDVTAIVAVNVTDWPNTDGFTLEVTAVVVLALLTTWLTLELVLVLKLVSPP